MVVSFGNADPDEWTHMMKRRHFFQAVGAAVMGLGGANTSAQPSTTDEGSLRSVTVLEVELQDDQNNPLTKAAQVVRLNNSLALLRRELAERHLYKVVDPAPAQEVERRFRSQQEFLYRCDDCAVQIGRAASVELVMTPWVQKVSELILNFNIQIVDVRSERVIFTKSVDMRGNDDESWSRAVKYLVRDMAEKRARNPKYGQ